MSTPCPSQLFLQIPPHRIGTIHLGPEEPSQPPFVGTYGLALALKLAGATGVVLLVGGPASGL